MNIILTFLLLFFEMVWLRICQQNKSMRYSFVRVLYNYNNRYKVRFITSVNAIIIPRTILYTKLRDIYLNLK